VARRPASSRAERQRLRAALVGLQPRPGPLDLAVRLVVRAAFGLAGWRIRADGWDQLPRDATGRVVPCVVAVAPHRGWTDPFLLLLTWPRDAPRLA
jgi:1-acyl-sn-glycerol-3-phosphate acyltransferase